MSEEPVDRDIEIARQVAVNLHKITVFDFIIALAIDTLCEGIVAFPSHLLIRLQEEGFIGRVSDGKYRVI